MSSGYSRNKYRCLLKSNVNVFHLDNNIQNQQNPNQQNPKPRIYPYGYPGGYPGSYPYPGGYLYGYPGSYPYPGGYPYGYPTIYPYVEKKDNVEKKDKPNPKMTSNYYYDSSSSSSSSDDSYRYRRRRYHVTKSPENEKVGQSGQQRNNICEPDPCEFDPFQEPKTDDPIPQRIFDEVKHEKNFAKPLAKLFTKFTTPENLEGQNQNQPQPQNEMNQIIQNESENSLEQKIDGKKIYLKS